MLITDINIAKNGDIETTNSVKQPKKQKLQEEPIIKLSSKENEKKQIPANKKIVASSIEAEELCEKD